MPSDSDTERHSPPVLEDAFSSLLNAIRAFNRDRDWGQYHSPKNLAMSLVIEAAELAEIFQWLTEEESARLSAQKQVHAEEEIGDVLIYLLNLADKLGIDPLEAARKKLELNGEKYPVHRSRGSADKYTEFK
jgi:dCTP diphosphatase